MQREFAASKNKRVIANCCAEISKAIDDRAYIIFVEFVSHGMTNKSLVKLTDSYSKTFFLRKTKNDGSKEILNLLRGFKIKPRLVKVCGVNTSYCVRDTVSGLSDRLKVYAPRTKIQVLSRSCNCYDNHRIGLMECERIHNVVIK